MKDDLGGKIMTEFVAIRAEMYAYRKVDKKVEEKCCKGTKRMFLKVLHLMTTRPAFNGETIYKEQMLLENKKHEVYTVNEYKIALNRENDKRTVPADKITTLAWGYVAPSA